MASVSRIFYTARGEVALYFSSKEVGMLIALIAVPLASMNAFVTGLADDAAPISINHASTLELALIAIGILAVYGGIKRYFSPADRRFNETASSITNDARATESSAVETSRGAA